MLYLDVWWFEIRAPMEFSDPPCFRGPIPPSKPQIQNTHKKNGALWTKYAKFRCLVIWNRGPSGIMRSPTCWWSNSTFKASNSKHPNFFWLFEPKWHNLDVWWFEIGAPVELWGPPRVGGPIPPSMPQIQNTHKKNWLLEPKLLNLDVWWFEIGALVELWGRPRIGGPILPSKSLIQNTHQIFLLFETKTTKFKCLVIWNWVSTSSAWCCNLCSKQLDLQKESKKKRC
jgi:hypothetical protein